MKLNNIFPVVLILLSVSCLSAQPMLNKLFSSGVYNGNQVDILVNGPAGTNVLTEAPGGLSQTQMENAWNLTDWQRISIDISPSAYLGFWYSYPEMTLNPFYYGGTQTPDLSIFAGLDNDAIGDHLYNSQWLDIAMVKHTFSADRLYFAMQCMGNSYPVSSGLTYFAYMPLLVDPDSAPEDNPIVYGLMYTVSVPGVISPGLYKITGSGFSGLTRIGDIVTSVQDGQLLLSCSLADLLADPDFSSWFDPSDPRIASVATTSRITLVSGIQQADVTPGLDLLLHPQAIPLQNLSAPQLTDAALLENQQDLLIPQITYFDTDHNFPRLASFSVDGGEQYPLSPVDLGAEAFAAPVVFSHSGIPEPATWTELRFHFSHGDDFVYYTLANGSAVADENQIPIPSLSLYPNPAKDYLKLTFSGAGLARYAIYNLKGQKLEELILDAKNERQLKLSNYPTGIYYLKPQLGKGQVKRFVKL